MRLSAGGLSAGVAALLLTAGCKEGKLANEQRESERTTASQTVEQAQEQSEQAFDEARVAQERASDEQQDAARAQRELQGAQQRLTEAQARAQTEAQQAQQAQQQAAQAPSSTSPQAQGEQFIVGEVLTVNDREVLVSTDGEPQLRLQVQPGTVIMVDGRQARATDIEEGSQVRASYRDQEGEPTATRIEVTTSRKPATPAAPNSGESSPGFEPQ